MSPLRSPNFRGQKAVILHREDENINRLTRHLDRLGMESTIRWPDLSMPTDQFDVLYFDGDNGHDDLFPWPKGAPTVPLIAMIGSEAPGRLEWVLSHNSSAHLIKPVQSSGVFSTLVIAYSNFERQRLEACKLEALEHRIAQRPAVFRALLSIIDASGLDDEAAFGILRFGAMSRRQSIEDFCGQLDKRRAAALVHTYRAGQG